MTIEKPHNVRVPVIGILGGIACGKSLVAGKFVELGAGLLDADRAAHAVLREPEVIETLRRQFGDAVLVDGQLARDRIAEIVFKDIQQLAFLEQTIHPRIGDLLIHEAEGLARQKVPALVLDAAVMVKAGWHTMCDKIVFVDAPFAVRLDRSRSRGWTESELSRRESAQTPLDVKRSLADVVIDNSGSSELTLAQVEQFWHSLFP